MQIRSCKGLQHAKALVKAHLLRGLPLLVLVTAAQADCAADFARDNRLKPEAGPFRVETETLFPVAYSQVAEVVPPQSMRRTVKVMGKDNVAIVVDGKAWVKQDERWQAMDLDKTDTAFQTYDSLQGVREHIECAPDTQGQGKPVRAYTYSYPTSGGPLAVAMAFDQQTGLPQKMTAKNAKGRQVMEMRFIFDRSIRVEAPKP